MYKKSSSIKEKSFTVIELLVVIALIGLLASIVLVSFNLPEKRYRATVAKSLEFSQSIQNAIGIDAVGWWNFDDEITDGYVTDTSGNGNTGKLCDSTGCGVGKGPTQTSNTPHKVAGTGAGKYALSFDGAAPQRVTAPRVLKGINTPFTVESWANTTNGEYWNTIVAEDCYGFDIAINNKTIMFGRNCGGGQVHHAGPKIKLGEWFHVVMGFDGSKTELYVNGKSYTKLTDANTYNHDLGSGVSIGAAWVSGGENFYGSIDEVRIYSQALTAQQIQQHYAEGLARHKNLGR